MFGDGIDWNAEGRRAANAELPGAEPGPMLVNIREAIAGVERPRVADCGCNIARFYPQFRDAGFAYVGVDQAEGALATARQRYPQTTFVHSFLWDDWPAKIEPVDVALCNAVLQHNLHHEKERIMARIAQAVRPGGVFAMQESTVPQATKTQLTQREWVMLVERYGFKLLKKWHPNPEYGLDDAYLFRRAS